MKALIKQRQLFSNLAPFINIDQLAIIKPRLMLVVDRVLNVWGAATTLMQHELRDGAILVDIVCSENFN